MTKVRRLGRSKGLLGRPAGRGDAGSGRQHWHPGQAAAPRRRRGERRNRHGRRPGPHTRRAGRRHAERTAGLIGSRRRYQGDRRESAFLEALRAIRIAQRRYPLAASVGGSTHTTRARGPTILWSGQYRSPTPAGCRSSTTESWSRYRRSVSQQYSTRTGNTLKRACRGIQGGAAGCRVDRGHSLLLLPAWRALG